MKTQRPRSFGYTTEQVSNGLALYMALAFIETDTLILFLCIAGVISFIH